MRRTLAHNGGTKPGPKVVWQLIEFRVTVDLDSFASGVADNVAIVAPRQMVIELCLRLSVQRAVEVVGQFVEKLRTLHWSPSPLAFF